MEVWAGKRHREIEASRGNKRVRDASQLPGFNGHDLDVIEDGTELFWSVVHGCAPPAEGEDQTPPAPAKRLPKYFKTIAPAYTHVDKVLEGNGVIVAEDATASAAWLKARGLPLDKVWKRFYTISLSTYHYRLLLDNELNKRNCYEVIRGHVPCHAYADVELYPANNPRMQTMDQFNEFMDIFLDIFENWVKNYLNVEVTRYTLESSAYDRVTGEPTKFSRHYKWVLSSGTTHAMFVNNAHVGALMQRFECFLIKKYGPSTRDGNIFYFWKEKIKHSPPDPFKDKSMPIDMGVYTDNRMYRMDGNQKLGSSRPLLPYEKAGDEKKEANENPSLEETILYSILCPPPDACGKPINLLTITRPDGTPAISTSNLYAHRASQHPHHISLHANGTSINSTHIPQVQDFIVYDDDTDYDDMKKPLCRGTTWGGRNGTSMKPNFCTPMSSAFCSAFSDELEKWGRRKNRTVTRLKMDHADFDRTRMQFTVTFKQYCHVLHADPASNTTRHRSNRGYFRINLIDMTYICCCLDPDHKGRNSVPQNIMQSIKETFGKRVEKFIMAFNTRYGLDPVRELCSIFTQLQTGSYTLCESSAGEEEASDEESACQGMISG